MRAIDIMTPSVIVASSDMAVQEAAKLLADNHIGGMPVVDEGSQVMGMVSEGDLLRRTEIETGDPRRAWWLELLASTRELASAYIKEHGHTVRDVMREKVVSVEESTPLADIASLLERNRIKRVPVLRDGKLVGIISRANLIRALASIQSDKSGSVSSDREIRDAIVRELSGHRWALPPENVIVKDGVVHLWGVIQSEEERHAICLAADGVPGVKEVKSHLDYLIVMPTTTNISL